MSTPRCFLDDVLAEGAELPGTAAQAHHLGTVLRRGVGDAVALFNARDGEFAATIAHIRRDRCTFALGTRRRTAAPEPDLRLMVAALKRDALDWVVEKATELGVSVIQPVTTRRSVVDRVNVERLSAIARGAAEQCERLSVPVLHAALPLHAALDAWDGAPLLVGAERRDAAPIRGVAATLRLPCGWLVGPEGGFDPGELDVATRRAFVTPVALGPRILRAETAAVAGLAVLQALAGDWTAI
jgi:16S rRNA (uracil1498-N3)-methyltransferase